MSCHNADRFICYAPPSAVIIYIDKKMGRGKHYDQRKTGATQEVCDALCKRRDAGEHHTAVEYDTSILCILVFGISDIEHFVLAEPAVQRNPARFHDPFVHHIP